MGSLHVLGVKQASFHGKTLVLDARWSNLNEGQAIRMWLITILVECLFPTPDGDRMVQCQNFSITQK